ncbi:MAG TPA: winged helix-turn-helix transcriptional regulator [Candidatus Bilamarchaeaceae archaeon]|nr:winged helix-turn-helix transcriptional regulator [Candidatus Bilamarchaeaceae archaeon]
MSLQKLDLVDRKILSELDKNARQTYSEIGKKIRVPKETVKYRIGLLQKKKIINGFYTVIDFSKIGFVLYRLYLRLQNITPKIENELIDYLTKSKVGICYQVNGKYHIALGVWVRDIWEYEEFWLDFKLKFGEYFADYSMSILTEYIEFSRTYLLQEKNPEKEMFVTLSRTTPEKLGITELKILEVLSNNARVSLVEIAKKLKVSIVTVRHHLKKLISKKIIIGFRPMLNLNSFGMEYYKVDLWFRKFGEVKEIKQNILSHPNVIYTERSVISSDLEFDIEVENFEEFIKIMNSFKEKFPEDIKDYAYYSRIKNYKTSYLPDLYK